MEERFASFRHAQVADRILRIADGRDCSLGPTPLTAIQSLPFSKPSNRLTVGIAQQSSRYGPPAKKKAAAT